MTGNHGLPLMRVVFGTWVAAGGMAHCRCAIVAFCLCCGGRCRWSCSLQVGDRGVLFVAGVAAGARLIAGGRLWRVAFRCGGRSRWPGSLQVGDCGMLFFAAGVAPVAQLIAGEAESIIPNW